MVENKHFLLRFNDFLLILCIVIILMCLFYFSIKIKKKVYLPVVASMLSSYRTTIMFIDYIL